MDRPLLQEGEKYSIYVIGPYTGNEEENVKIAFDWADKILAAGFMPYVPHWTHYWDKHSPKPYEFWMEYSIHMMILFDAIFRIPGESKGADVEEEYAKYQTLPFFTDLDEMTRFLLGTKHPPEVVRRSTKPPGFTKKFNEQLGLFSED